MNDVRPMQPEDVEAWAGRHLSGTHYGDAECLYCRLIATFRLLVETNKVQRAALSLIVHLDEANAMDVVKAVQIARAGLEPPQ